MILSLKLGVVIQIKNIIVEFVNLVTTEKMHSRNADILDKTKYKE